MNKFFLLVAVAFCTTTTFAQTTLYQAKLTKEVVPAVILEAISEDFPDATVSEYAAIPVDVIEDRIYVNANQDGPDRDYDTYVVTMTGKTGAFQATYNQYGMLLSTSEVLKDVPLPRPVQISMYRHFPGWGAVDDKVVMTSVKDGQLKTHYKVKLQKGKESIHVVFDADGNVIHGADKAKAHRQIKFREHREKMEKAG